MNIAESLVTNGVVTAEQMRELSTRAGTAEELRQLLIDEGVASDQLIAKSLARSAGVAFIDLAQESLDAETVGLIPAALCRRYQLIPVHRTRRRLIIGMADPSNLIAIDDITTATGYSIQPVAVAVDALAQAFARFLRMDSELTELTDQIIDASGASDTTGDTSLEVAGDDDAPVVRFVSLLISQAIDDRASDIHIEPGEHNLIVRYRIDGVLQETQQASRAIQDGVISRLKIMASVDIAERRKPQDGRISVMHNGRKIDLRLATLPTVWGEKIVMRIMGNSTQKMKLEDLSFSAGNQKLFRDSIAKPYGMVLVTGPTGSGKSTTLYTALSEIATNEVNAITVEDPVEFRLAGVNQVQVNHRAGLNFHTALRSILRSDPDIVMVGEIRDEETANMAIEAALTGHMVLSTLHTNDAPSALTRFINMGCEPFLVGTAITAVVAQRLARRLCICKKPYYEDGQKLVSMGVSVTEANPVFYQPGGCRDCSNTGYRGRLALHEVMTMSEELEHLVTTNATSSALRDSALRHGMLTLRQDGFAKAYEGMTTIAEVLRVSV